MFAEGLFLLSSTSDASLEADHRCDCPSECCLCFARPPPSATATAAPPTSPTTVMAPEDDDNDGLPLSTPYFVSDLELQQADTRPGRRAKSVSFSDEIWLYRSDRTEEEVQRSWYNREEISAFKSERRFVIQMLRAVDFRLELIDETTCCLRGYEAYFSVEYNKATKFVREAALRAVLSEQHRQRSMVAPAVTMNNNPYRLTQHDVATVSDDDNNNYDSSIHRVWDASEAFRRACRETSEWAFRNARELGDNDAAFAHHLYRVEMLMCCR